MKIAFIIPIHPKHYKYLYDLIELLDTNKIEIDIFLIFSNEDDYNEFEKKDKIKKMVLLPNTNTENIVTYKKFFALEKLKNDTNYDYFIVCDAEISIIPENLNEKNMINKIDNIFKNRYIYGGEVNYSDTQKIIKTSYDIVKKKINLFNNKFFNYNLFFWWSDLPVYKREHLNSFFKYIDYSNINWFHFDHKIYLNYLYLYHNFNIINVTPLIKHNWSLESYYTNDIQNLYKLKSIKYGFSFITPRIYEKFKNFFIEEGSFLIYHLDR